MKFMSREFTIGELLLSFLILTYFVIITLLTPELDPESRLFPSIVLTIAIPLGIINLLTVVNQKTHDFFSETQVIKQKSIKEKAEGIDLKAEVKSLCWMLFYLALFFLVGPLIAIIIAPLIAMRYIGNMKWRTSILVVAATWCIVYAVFVVMAGTRLPAGLIWESIM